MQVRDVMTESLAFCPPEKTLDDVARMMVACDCGAVPVVDLETQRVIGMVTDRDIVCRAVAMGRDPSRVRAADVMSMPITAVTPSDSIESCVEEMERAQVRRMPVIDEQGRLCGIVAQADIARAASPSQTGYLVQDVSKPTGHASNVH